MGMCFFDRGNKSVCVCICIWIKQTLYGSVNPLHVQRFMLSPLHINFVCLILCSVINSDMVVLTCICSFLVFLCIKCVQCLCEWISVYTNRQDHSNIHTNKRTSLHLNSQSSNQIHTQEEHIYKHRRTNLVFPPREKSSWDTRIPSFTWWSGCSPPCPALLSAWSAIHLTRGIDLKHESVGLASYAWGSTEDVCQ